MSAQPPAWPRLLELFERLADASATERGTQLARIGATDPVLRTRLEHLLALDASTSDLAAEVCAWRDQLIDAEPAPQRLGPWRIAHELGAGGMGRVFLAERADGGYEQTVALKIVRGEFTSDAALARFLAERRILARLDHPGIAGLVDGGVDETGRPWFAMRFVDGVPLPQWCAARKAGLDARVRLMIAVCDAVAYAHRLLVVHCDLKPSNVLVDAAANPHLLDFGIARLIGTTPDNRARHGTQTLSLALTPGYASPEQLAGEPVGIATDVYAIGAMLHEVLSGQRPYAGHDETPAAAVLAQARGEPPPASRVAGDRMPFPATRLHGDLDAIIATALRHDPAARYPDAAALAEDLRACLAGRPLRAQRTSATRRAVKFVRRHRAGVSAAAFAVLALLATTAVALYEARVARKQATRADAVRSFLIDLFEQNEPARANGKPLTARELVDLGSQRAAAGLSGDPDTRIELLGTVGHLYGSLGDWNKQDQVLQLRVDLAAKRYARGDPRLAQARLDLARADAATGRLDRAREQASLVLAALPAATDARGLRAAALGTLGEIERRAGHFAQAATLQAQRVALLRADRSTTPQTLGTALDDLARAQVGSGEYALGETNARESLRLLTADPATRSTTLIGARSTLAEVLLDTGKLDQAEALNRENLAAAKHVYGANNPQVGDIAYALADSIRMQGRAADSVPLFQQALALYEQALGPDSSQVAISLIGLAQAQTDAGAPTAAIANLERSYAIYAKTRGPGHLNALVAQIALGRARLSTGDAIGAGRDFRDALGKFTGPLEHHIYAESARQGLGEALAAQHRYADAEPLLERAHATLAGKFGIGDFRSVGAAIALAPVLAAAGKMPAAQQLLAQARQAVQALPPQPSAAKQLARLQAAENQLEKRAAAH